MKYRWPAEHLRAAPPVPRRVFCYSATFYFLLCLCAVRIYPATFYFYFYEMKMGKLAEYFCAINAEDKLQKTNGRRAIIAGGAKYT